MNDFEKALKFVLRWEGFVSDDPNDPGGLTIWGISARSHKDAVFEMKRLIEQGDKDKAFKICKKIYKSVYWDKMGCEVNTYPWNIIKFDTAVNMGRSRAQKLLVGCNTWQDYLLNRLYTYSKFKQAKLYFRGWSNRVLDLYRSIEEE